MAIKFNQGRYRFGAMNGGPQDIWATFTASSTVTYLLPGYFRRRYLERLTVTSASALTGGGTLTVTLKKVASGVTTTLTAPFDVKTLAANVAQRIPVLTTLGENVFNFSDGDVITADVIASGTVTAQPTQGIHLGVEWDVLG